MKTVSTYFSNLRPSAKDVARSLVSLPSAPQVLPQLYGLLRRGDTSLQQVGELVRIDPGLTARIFEKGNRLASAKGGDCLTIEEAINFTGFEAISSIIAEVADSQALARPVSLYGLDADEMWRWCIACALAAETIADVTGDDTGMAFTTGLLHCVGMVALDNWTQRNDPMLACASACFPREFSGAERALFGLTQADVGAELLRSWSFPSTMVEAIRWQYTPMGSAGYARAACLLHSAKWLRAVVCNDDEIAPPMPSAKVLESLMLTTDQLARMVVEVRVKLGMIRGLVHFLAA